MTETRTNKVILVVGGRGVGKTSWLKKLILKSKFQKKLIVEMFHSPVWHDFETFDNPEGAFEMIPVIPMNAKLMKRWKRGVAFTYSSSKAEIFEVIESAIMNCLVVFEDATKYLKRSLTDEQESFVVDSKQKNVDLIFVFHSLSAVPPRLVALSDILVLFKTKDGKLKSAYDPWPELQQNIDELRNSNNKYVHKIISLN